MTYFFEDMTHPNTAGHQRAADTLLSNLPGNSAEKHLYRVYTAHATAIENIASSNVDGDFKNALSLLKAGGVDVGLNLIINASRTVQLVPISFDAGSIAFGTIMPDDAGGMKTLVIWWNEGGNLYYAIR